MDGQTGRTCDSPQWPLPHMAQDQKHARKRGSPQLPYLQHRDGLFPRFVPYIRGKGNQIKRLKSNPCRKPGSVYGKGVGGISVSFGFLGRRQKDRNRAQLQLCELMWAKVSRGQAARTSGLWCSKSSPYYALVWNNCSLCSVVLNKDFIRSHTKNN